MLQDEHTFRSFIAKNIAAYRKAHGDTQLDLANKLNYSDKSVSKWERGDGLPDVFILARIAEIYGVTVSNLIGEVQPPKKSRPHFHAFVMALSVVLVFVVASLVFVTLLIADVPAPAWMCYIYALPVAAVVSLVFGCIWKNLLIWAAAGTVLIWTGGLALELSIPKPNSGLIFVGCAAIQVLMCLWTLFRLWRKKNRQK